MTDAIAANSTETIVGAAVVAVAAGFFLYASSIAGSSTSISGGYKLTAEFDSVEGVNVGTDVRLAGIKIGTVTAQTLNPENYQAKLELVIDPKVSLSDDSTAKISSEGLLGGKFISLEPGGSDAKLTNNGVISNTQGAVDIWSLLSEAMFNKGKPGESMPAPKPEDGGAVTPDTPEAEVPAAPAEGTN